MGLLWYWSKCAADLIVQHISFTGTEAKESCHMCHWWYNFSGVFSLKKKNLSLNRNEWRWPSLQASIGATQCIFNFNILSRNTGTISVTFFVWILFPFSTIARLYSYSVIAWERKDLLLKLRGLQLSCYLITSKENLQHLPSRNTQTHTTLLSKMIHFVYHWKTFSR